MPPTHDQAALAILLSGASRQARNTALARLNRAAAHDLGSRCPECGGADCQDNGARAADLAFLCTGCGHQWMPAETTTQGTTR